MAQESVYNLLTKEERVKEGISRFACQKAHVDFCPRLPLEIERVHKETDKQLASALKELNKYREYFQILMSTVKSLLEPHSIILNIFKSQLANIPDIKARYFAKTAKVISFWLFIEEDNWEVEENIYEAYGQLLDFFPDTEIDLRLLKLYDRKPKELLPDGFQPW